MGKNRIMERLIGSRNGLMILLFSIPSPTTGESKLISSPSTGEDKGGGESRFDPHFNTCLRQTGRGGEGGFEEGEKEDDAVAPSFTGGGSGFRSISIYRDWGRTGGK